MPLTLDDNPLMTFYNEAINNNHVDVLDDIYVPHYVNHAAPFGLKNDVEGLKHLLLGFAKGIPDQHIVADHLFFHEDLIVARWTLTGTHTGDFFGVPATGKPITMTGIDIERLEGEKIAEHWGAEDMLALLTQIGVADPPDVTR